MNKNPFLCALFSETRASLNKFSIILNNKLLDENRNTKRNQRKRDQGCAYT